PQCRARAPGPDAGVARCARARDAAALWWGADRSTRLRPGHALTCQPREGSRNQRLHAAPARPPHAERHCDLDYLIRAHVADGYVAASDMLTRAGPKSEFATDTAVRKRGIDPSTGTRYLEELAVEVASTHASCQP